MVGRPAQATRFIARLQSLAEAKREIEAWRRDYNESRPHMALNDLTPGEFVRQYSLRPTAEGS
ncbi:integrase core domain-containing protein [Paraburkholderia sejongensis]|uniref:integrase core domain-containing protein n=1 Tax=Paraburkholderia sejongensis TaxID=2886946 RepID=UPI003CE5206D